MSDLAIRHKTSMSELIRQAIDEAIPRWDAARAGAMVDMPKRNPVVTVLEVVARYYDIRRGPEKLKRSEASLAHAKPRHVAMYLVRTLCMRSFPDIGRDFGGYDHTTVMHAYNKIHTELLKLPGGELKRDIVEMTNRYERLTNPAGDGDQ